MMRRFTYTNFWDRIDPQKEVEIRETWSVQKVLKGRDIDNGQLIMPKREFKDYILSQLPPEKKNAVEHGERVTVKVRDVDMLKTEELTMWKNASDSYVLTQGWKDLFVKPKNLLVGDKVGLSWAHAEAELLFTVISRAE